MLFRLFELLLTQPFLFSRFFQCRFLFSNSAFFGRFFFGTAAFFGLALLIGDKTVEFLVKFLGLTFLILSMRNFTSADGSN